MVATMEKIDGNTHDLKNKGFMPWFQEVSM